MSVINTNYLALVSQNNLAKSQNALGTAIERLSSGLRINSAKDDAAGQAIANRFTANIKGLTQASRNANDGISIAQTTEGALNEINNNLQRIRELSVQAANGSNSGSDLDSIQAEIQQRLGEIDRVSEQTQFNGVHVLAQKNSLTVQVGAHDNQTISVNLRQINAETLKLGTFNVNGATTNDFSVVKTTRGGGDVVQKGVALSAGANTIDPSSLPQDSGIETDGNVYATTTPGEYAVKANVGGTDTYFKVEQNPVTNKWVWDSSDPGSIVVPGNIDGKATTTPETSNFNTTDVNNTDWISTKGGAGDWFNVTGGVAVNSAAIDTAALGGTPVVDDIYRDNTNGQYYAKISGAAAGADDGFYAVTIGNDGKVAPTALATGTALAALPNPASSEVVTTNFTAVNINYSAGLFSRNDAPNFIPDSSGDGGTQLYAVKGWDDNYYSVEAKFTYGGSGDKTDISKYTVEFNINASASGTTQVSVNNVGATIDGSGAGRQLTFTQTGVFDPENDLYNLAAANLPTALADDVYALTDGSDGYAVKASNGNYYAAGPVDENGAFTWDSSTGKLDPAIISSTKAATGDITITGNITGVAAGEQLLSYEDSSGNLAYVVQTGTGNDAVYTKATLGAVDATTGNRALIKATGDDAALHTRSVDPLKALDAALQEVDSLRSELGAVQNRFQSTIANLSNTVNNLSAARSRIEDADYAVEVSNMTRAQILQQAGTSVLAQANQVPQTVLSLLR